MAAAVASPLPQADSKEYQDRVYETYLSKQDVYYARVAETTLPPAKAVETNSIGCALCPSYSDDVSSRLC